MSSTDVEDIQVLRRDRRAEWQRKAKGAGVAHFISAMRCPGDDDALDGPRWIIPGILLEGQTAMCPGAPGTGKSFAILDWLVRVSCGLDFMAKPTLQGGTIYVTGEGQAGISKRIAALAGSFTGLQSAPFLYLSVMPRLLEPQQVKDFIAAIKIAIEDWQLETRIIAFDTFNRAIVGGSENEGKDVARLLDADSRIKDALGCATIYAHHPGKAEGNDTRGHSSLRGDIDVTAVFSSKTDTRTIEIKKQKDEEDGAIFGYSLRKVDLGSHKTTGDAVTSCLVDWLDAETVRGVRSSQTRWPKGLRIFNETITAAILDAGQNHQPSGDGPLLKATTVDAARAIHRKKYVHAGEGDPAEAERKAWQRNFKQARDGGLIGGETVNGVQLVWLAKAGTSGGTGHPL